MIVKKLSAGLNGLDELSNIVEGEKELINFVNGRNIDRYKILINNIREI